MAVTSEQVAHAITEAIVKADAIWSEQHRNGLRQRERIVEFVTEAVLPLVAEARVEERQRLEDGLRHLDPDSWYKPAAVMLELGLSVKSETQE